MISVERTFSKDGYPEGPWITEPDLKVWADESTGLPCAIVRNDAAGNLCGYVGVVDGHPWFGEAHPPADVHGSVTFAGSIKEIDEIAGVSDVWWVGFDCMHSRDLLPLDIQHHVETTFETMGQPIPEEIKSLLELFSKSPFKRTYRDFTYVTSEIEKLARQASVK